MDLLLRNLRYALRSLAREKGLAFVAILTLALAIGANTALFSVAYGVLARPLPFPAPEQLLQLQRGYSDGASASVSAQRFQYWQEHGRTSFAKMAAYDDLGSGFNLAGDGEPERFVGSRTSLEFFDVLGMHPSLGRGFEPADDRPGAPRVVVLSHGMWTRRFGASPSLLGRTLTLNEEPYTVVGVMPEGFQFPATAQLWTPLQLAPASTERANYLMVTGRLASGLNRERAPPRCGPGDWDAAELPGVLDDNETIQLKPLAEHLHEMLAPLSCCCSGRWDSCCSSHASISPTCNLRALRPEDGRRRCEPRSEPAPGASRSSCSRRAC